MGDVSEPIAKQVIFHVILAELNREAVFNLHAVKHPRHDCFRRGLVLVPFDGGIHLMELGRVQPKSVGVLVLIECPPPFGSSEITRVAISNRLF